MSFTLDIDHYEKVVAVRKAIGLGTSNYLDSAKKSLKDGNEFIVNGNKVVIRRGYCLN